MKAFGNMLVNALMSSIVSRGMRGSRFWGVDFLFPYSTLTPMSGLLVER
jgi:hypothetical protein